jgi:ribosomal protein L37E
METEIIITIVSAGISIVTMVVFFVMAYNIGKIARDVRDLKQAGFLFMNNKGVTTNFCPGCRNQYYSMNDEREYCPHCGYLNINKKRK